MIEGYRALGAGAGRAARRPRRRRRASTSGPPAASWAPPGRCANGSRRSGESPSSRPNRPCCAADRPGTHRIEGGGVGLRAAAARRLRDSMRSSRSRPRRRSRWPAGRPRGGRVVRPVDRREPRRRVDGRPPARARCPRRHDPGRLGAQVPRARSTPERVRTRSASRSLRHPRFASPGRRPAASRFSGILYRWAEVSPSTGVVFRCLYGLPLLVGSSPGWSGASSDP